MVASLAGPAAGTPRALRRPCQGRPGPGDPASLDPHDLRGAARARRVLRNRGLTVVAAPADTDYTIRLENVGTGLAHGRPRRRGTDRPRHRRLPRAQPPGPQPRHARARAHAHRVMTAHAVEVAARARRTREGSPSARHSWGNYWWCAASRAVSMWPPPIAIRSCSVTRSVSAVTWARPQDRPHPARTAPRWRSSRGQA